MVRDTLFCTARLSSERGILVHWPHKTCSDTHLQVSDSYMPLSPQCIHFVEVNEALLTPGTPAIIAKQCKLCGAHLCIAHPGWGGIGTSLIDGQCLPHSPYPSHSLLHSKWKEKAKLREKVKATQVQCTQFQDLCKLCMWHVTTVFANCTEWTSVYTVSGHVDD